MIDESPPAPLVIRMAAPEDIQQLDLLDSFSTSPSRNIHREMEKYFGSTVLPCFPIVTQFFLSSL
jgi:hypothetical protein